ncbi:MAG: S-layer homology domain-containing protein [Candidatus Margulisbacteria bacterium]|nr:S-layer homology domain-containing protein [Candidatus Margulisiibacteriota bacterium]
MKRLLISLLIVQCLLFGAARAELAEIGINPLKLEIGARPLGMGAAFSGLADDVNSALYNPGGLAWVKGVSLTVKDVDNLTGVMAFPTGNNSSLGLAIVKAKNSTAGAAVSNSNIVLLSYGTKLNFIPLFANQELFQRLGFGIGVKGLLSESLLRPGQSDRSATGWDLDLGVLWKGSDWWSAGIAAQNVLPAGSPLGGGQLAWDVGGTETVPATFKLGGSARPIGDLRSPVFMEGRELSLSGELDLSRSSALLRVGGEWGINKTFYFRTGILQQDRPGGSTTNLSFGLGWRSEEWGADIARSHEPLRDEDLIYFSVLYFPRDWIVQTKLDVDKPAMLESALQKISLADNLETYDDRIEVLGQVKSGVEVYVNDARAVTGDDNNFKVTVPLQLGKNLVVVEARYQGEKKDWTYKVLRKARVEVVGGKKEELARQKQKVEELVTLGVVEVTPGAEFKLDASLTRGDLATWLAKASGFRLPKVERDLYADVKKDNPLAPFIKVVVEAGLLAPFPDGTFRPDTPVAKEEGDRLFKLLKKAAR